MQLKVRNIGFPEWITDDAKLNIFLKHFPLSQRDNLIETIFAIGKFKLAKHFEPLAWEGNTNRTEFGENPLSVCFEYIEHVRYPSTFDISFRPLTVFRFKPGISPN